MGDRHGRGVKGLVERTGDCEKERERERERGSCYIDFCKREQIAKIPFQVQKISIDRLFGKLSAVTN